MRIRDVELRPLGGRLGCLAMVLLSAAASLLLTILLNVFIRL